MPYVRPKYSLILEHHVIRVLVDFRGASIAMILQRVGAREHRDKVMVGMILRTYVDAGYVRKYGKDGFILLKVPPDPLRGDPPIADAAE